MNGGSAARKPLALPEEEEVSSVVFSPSSLYFSQSDADLLNEPKQEEAPPSSKSSAKSLQDSMMPLSVRLWRVAGCHELLASVGFDLTEVGADQVVLRTGKQANRRQCQFVLQALLALFGK